MEGTDSDICGQKFYQKTYEEIFPDSSKESEILAQFAGDFSIHTFENDYFCDCWLRYYIGVSREVAADAIREHINNKIF